ncbi:hypothetical protein [Aureivirga sp. CE67]|uniref:hypothetical protein n=1 Tax=Aureivirga sp. CE67 TaxID=1788983 RepID=UPI0018CAE630|nr:hypothetical protein [Aureivirga sp. CE67]
MASKSQITFSKKEREKAKALKKRIKNEKREARKENDKKGVEINWAIAPKNRTLTQEDIENKESNKMNHINQ